MSSIRLASHRWVLWVGVCLSFAAVLQAGQSEKRDLPKSKGFYILVKPPNFDPNKSYDLVVALHGMGDTAQNYARIFAGFLRGRDALLAVPEGSAQVGPGYTWNTDDLDRVVELLEDVSQAAKYDKKRVLLAGHSAGSMIGWYILTKKPELFAFYGQTAQGVAPAINYVIRETDLAKLAGKPPIYFAIGKKDPNHPNVEPSKKLLEKYKFNFKYEEPDIPHTITGEEVKNMLAFFDATVKK